MNMKRDRGRLPLLRDNRAKKQLAHTLLTSPVTKRGPQKTPPPPPSQHADLLQLTTVWQTSHHPCSTHTCTNTHIFSQIHAHKHTHSQHILLQTTIFNVNLKQVSSTHPCSSHTYMHKHTHTLTHTHIHSHTPSHKHTLINIPNAPYRKSPFSK